MISPKPDRIREYFFWLFLPTVSYNCTFWFCPQNDQSLLFPHRGLCTPVKLAPSSFLIADGTQFHCRSSYHTKMGQYVSTSTSTSSLPYSFPFPFLPAFTHHQTHICSVLTKLQAYWFVGISDDCSSAYLQHPLLSPFKMSEGDADTAGERNQ